jgi:RNA polymerase sigma-70 factor (ECF subfamily)
VLVDIARKRRAERRGGPNPQRVRLDDVDVPMPERNRDIIAIDNALEALALEDPRKARLVELRFFGGLSVDEAAEALGVSPRTIDKEWAFARVWLYRLVMEELR